MSPEELAETWRTHSAKLLLIARAVGEPAEDAVQEAFLQLAVQTHRPTDTFGWLVVVARNQLLQWRRSGDRRRRREQNARPANWFSGENEQTETALDAREITAALETLAPDVREVIVMHLWGEMSFETIAGITGRSRSSAHRIYQQGIQQMKKRFSPTDVPVIGRQPK